MHPDDDVARNIRAQQNRDAMPSPEEVEASHRSHLAGEGCADCGEDDPDHLDIHQPLTSGCSAIQQQPTYSSSGGVPGNVLCDDCADERPDSYREKRRREAHRRNDEVEAGERDEEEAIIALAEYKCGFISLVEAGEVVPHIGRNPSIPVSHPRCGGALQDVFWVECEVVN